MLASVPAKPGTTMTPTPPASAVAKLHTGLRSSRGRASPIAGPTDRPTTRAPRRTRRHRPGPATPSRTTHASTFWPNSGLNNRFSGYSPACSQIAHTVVG